MTSLPQQQHPITCPPTMRDDQIDGIELAVNPNTAFPEQTIDLPPIDGGTRAWCLLLAAFVFEALLWGFPLSFGVFQEYYSHLPQFRNNSYVSAIGTTASGISYLGAPLATALTQRWSRYRTQMILLGWPLCIAGLVAGSFADTLGTLLLTQGVLYGIGFVIFYYPIISMVDEYWVRRRGMAYGILCSSSGVSGAVTPIIIQQCLHRFGYQTTLRGVAVLLTVTTGPLIPMLKGRYRHDVHQPVSLRTDWTFLRKRIFWTYSMSNIWMGLGYFFPAVYLPSYATLIGIGPSKGALLLAIMCLSQVAGQFTFGFLSDKHVSVDALAAVASSVSAVVTFCVWGFARSFLPLGFFAVLYGFFGAGYTAMYARMVTKVSDEPSSSQVMFGFFCAGKGIGNILTGPLSAGLLRLSSSSFRYGYGTYQAVIVFTGSCLLMSAVSLGFAYLKPNH